MDIHDLWQENKRWILGVVLGLMVYWIGTGVIGGVYDSRAVKRKISTATRALSDREYYGEAALATAKQEREVLEQARSQLQAGLAFTIADEFNLEGKGVADLHYDQVRRRVRRDLITRAEALGIELLAKDLQWATPQGRVETQSTLVALNLVEAAMGRLLDAHEAVISADPEARGVTALESLRIDGGRPGARQRGRPRRGEDAVDPNSLIEQVQVRFKLQADAATTQRFLEACRAEQPPIALVDFKMTSNRNAGDPLSVSGTLAAIRILEQP